MRIHFIAIGGSAMHNLAIALSRSGHVVTGSDDQIFDPSRGRLEKEGLLPATMGWNPSTITSELDAVILGMHARADNPELLAAQEKGINIFSFPEFLYQVGKNQTRVVIAGSHGKTTTTSMVLHVLQHAGKTVDFMVGAQLEGFDCMVELSSGSEFMLLEGDEYLSSPIDPRPKFLWYKPNIAVITGIAWDHINVFPTFESYVDQFKLFIEEMEHGGVLVYNADDPVLKKLVEETAAPVKKIPFTTPEYTVQGNQVVVDTPEGPLPLQVFGKHNVSNMEAARWMCLEMGVHDDEFYEAMASFGGAQKRMEPIHNGDSLDVFRDFAHAPSKVKASAEALAEQYKGKVRAVLELHTFSSLNPAFLPQYHGALDAVDEGWVYFSPDAVAHKKLPELSAEDVQEAFGPGIRVFTDAEELSAAVQDCAGVAAIALMSSGNFGGMDIEGWLKSL